MLFVNAIARDKSVHCVLAVQAMKTAMACYYAQDGECMKPASVQQCSALGNLVLFAIDKEVVNAFVNRGLPPKVWIRKGRKTGSEVMDDITVFYHTPLKVGQVNAVFSPTLTAELADRVRAQAMPYFIRNINRAERCAWDRKKSWVDYHCRLEMMIHWYHNMLVSHNIDTIVFNSTPHGGSTIAAFFLAKEMGLKIAICIQTFFLNRFCMVSDFSDIGIYESSVAKDIFQDVQIVDKPEKPFYITPTESKWNIIGQMISNGASLAFNLIMQRFGELDKSAPRRRTICTLWDRMKMISLQRSLPAKIEFKEKFIYFPLHFQPELTADVFGGVFGDQILAIESLRRILPEDVHIYVKENPIQTMYAREPSFFKRLEAIPNVTYVSISADTYEMIDRCQAVATIVGTAGWEAVQMGKPVICFGRAWYRCLPGVFDWDKGVVWDEVVNYCFNKEKLKQAVAQLSRHFRPGVIDTKSYAQIIDGFDFGKNADAIVDHLIDYFENYQQGPRSRRPAESASGPGM